MPSRAANIITFLTITAVLVSCHVYIFRQLKALLLRDFPDQAVRWTKIAKLVFIYLDLPFAYLFFSRHITTDVSVLAQVLLYPFVVWQFLMAVWSAILVPMGMYKALRSRYVTNSSEDARAKPIVWLVRRKKARARV